MHLITVENVNAFNVCLDISRCVDIVESAREIAIYFAKRKLPWARRIASFPLDKRAARWLKCFKENRSSRLSISFEESCKSILTAGRASYWTKNSNSSISRVRGWKREGEYGNAIYSVCIHCAFSVLLTGTNPGCQE